MKSASTVMRKNPPMVDAGHFSTTQKYEYRSPTHKQAMTGRPAEVIASAGAAYRRR